MESFISPVRSLRGHANFIQEVAFSNNGNELKVISTSDDKTVRIWDVKTGNQVGNPFEGHGSGTVGLAVSTDGRRIASGGFDGKIMIWDAETKRIIRCLSHHTDWAVCIQFSPDDKGLASASLDGTLKIWNAETGNLMFNLDDHQGRVWTAAYSPSGIQIASGSKDRTVRVWNARTGTQQFAQPLIHDSVVCSIVWSPDSRLLISACSDGQIYFWSAPTGAQLGSPFQAHSDRINLLAISPDGELIASACNDATARLWSTTTRKPFGRVLRHADTVYTVAFSPSRQLVATGGTENTIFLWDISQESFITTTHAVSLPSIVTPASHTTTTLNQPYASSHSPSASSTPASDELPDETDYYPYRHLTHAVPLISTSSSSETTATEQQANLEFLGSASDSLQDLTNELQGRSTCAIASGGFADVWKCYLLKPSGAVQVAVKAIRAFESDGNAGMRLKAKKVRRELKVWGRLKHHCILPLWGVANNFGPYPAMICPWADHGALTGFLERQQDMLSYQDRFSLLNDVALGLEYLHSKSVVHGDLTGSNVLIYANGRACLADFGLSTIILEFIGTSYFTSSIKGNIRWAAAELFEVPEDDEEEEAQTSLSTECDIYSFGSITLQVLTGKVPYYNVKKDNVVLGHVIRGKKPEPPRESRIEPAHWEFIQRCWLPRSNRPSVREAVVFVARERQAQSS